MRKTGFSSFLKGAASLGDLFAVTKDPEIEAILQTSDADALRNDWRTISRDFSDSLEITRSRLGLPAN
jgi:hypothetical protein